MPFIILIISEIIRFDHIFYYITYYNSENVNTTMCHSLFLPRGQWHTMAADMHSLSHTSRSLIHYTEACFVFLYSLVYNKI